MRRFFITLCLVACGLSSCAQTVAILGDSYSTFEGFVTPSTNELWYFVKNDGRTDVTDVTQTWWWQVVKEGGYHLGVNNSYSGSTIGFRGYNGDDYTARSFITRMTNWATPISSLSSAPPTTVGQVSLWGNTSMRGGATLISLPSARQWHTC